jgi:hypothetical protein
VGEKGETPRGRIDEAAAATGPGMKATDHHRTDGVSLATPASGPQLVKPPPPSVESTTPPARTPPHANESCGKGQQAAGDDDDICRAHERVDDPAHGADMSTDAAAPHHDQAKATTDQGHQSTTSASAPSVSHDLPDEDTKTTDLPRPSRDPADATGDDEHRPDAPTEPPDKPKGRKGRRGETRVKTGVSEGTGDEGDDGVETRRPEKPGEPRVESEGLPEVEVEPSGETGVGQDERAAHQDTDAMAGGMAEEAHGDVHAEVERSTTCRDASIEVERWSASGHIRSTTRVEENGQRTSRDDDNVPGALHDPHPPSTSPDETARPQNEPPSVELEGESIPYASCDVGLTSAETNAPGAPKDVEDDEKMPKKLRKASELEHERSEWIKEENPPRTARDKQDEPGGEAVAPDGPSTYLEGPVNDRNQRVEETNAQCRGTWPGGDLYLQGKSRGEEVVPDRDKVVDSAGYDRIHPRGQENERDVDTNASCRDPGPGGHSGEREDSGEVEDDRDRWSDGNGDRRGGRRGGKDGATSGARRDSKRVETTPLAEGETGQHGRRKRTTADVPETSTPPSNHPRRPRIHPNPPRRRGRTKPRPIEVSHHRWTYQATRTCQSRIGRIGRVVLDVLVYGPETVIERYRGAIREDEAARVEDRAQRGSATTTRAATYHIWTPRDQSDATRTLRMMLHGRIPFV